MGERRKRKSVWDMEDDTKTFPGMSEHNSTHDFSSSRTSTWTKSGDHYGKLSGESNEEKSSLGPLNAGLDKKRQNSPEGKEIGGGENRYYQNTSPRFNGIERHKYKHYIDSDKSNFRRHPKRNRSRSRSNGSPRGCTRSHSPVRDYRHQSEKSSRICREFSAGRCTRGSQCRFLHSKNNKRGHISNDSNFREDKGNSNAESTGEKNMGSNIQQQDHGIAQSYVLDEGNGSENPTHPIFFSGQDMNQNGHSSATDDELNLVKPALANGFGGHLDGPEVQLEACLDFQSQTLRGSQNDAQMTELTPVINPAVFPTPSIKNAIKLPGITETEITTSQSSPVRVSRCPISPLENERVPSEHGNLTQPENTTVDDPGNSKLKQEATALANSEAGEGNNNKVARLFKNSLIEFVKDILKPTWKEGRLSRDVHKTIVKKVVDKVTSTVQDDHIPKTQEKVDQYLVFSRPKIGKLVQAYVECSLKTDS